jgi:hypothetical protein
MSGGKNRNSTADIPALSWEGMDGSMQEELDTNGERGEEERRRRMADNLAKMDERDWGVEHG